MHLQNFQVCCNICSCTHLLATCENSTYNPINIRYMSDVCETFVCLSTSKAYDHHRLCEMFRCFNDFQYLYISSYDIHAFFWSGWRWTCPRQTREMCRAWQTYTWICDTCLTWSWMFWGFLTAWSFLVKSWTMFFLYDFCTVLKCVGIAFGRSAAREYNVRFRAIQMLQTSRHGLLELKAVSGGCLDEVYYVYG